MINLIRTPQESDNYKVRYETHDDLLNVTVGEVSEVFDFTNLPEGVAEEITPELLPINPIIAVEKIADIVSITVIHFYDKTEKDLYEVVV